MPPPPPPPPPGGPAPLSKAPAKKWPTVDVPPPPPSSNTDDLPFAPPPPKVQTNTGEQGAKKWASIETHTAKGAQINYNKGAQKKPPAPSSSSSSSSSSSCGSCGSRPTSPPPAATPTPPPPPAPVAAPVAIAPPPPPPAPVVDDPPAPKGSLAEMLKNKSKALNKAPSIKEPSPTARSEAYLDDSAPELTFGSSMTMGRSTEMLKGNEEKEKKKAQRVRTVEKVQREARGERERRRDAISFSCVPAGGKLAWVVVAVVAGVLGFLTVLGVLLFFFYFKPSIGVEVVFLDSNITSSSNVSSIKYLIRSIELCDTVAVSSVGFSSSAKCLTLYNAPVNHDPGLFSLSSATRNSLSLTQDPWTDFLSKPSTALLTASTKITGIEARTYSHVLVKYYRPVRVMGSVRVASTVLNQPLITLSTRRVAETGDFRVGVNGVYAVAGAALTESAGPEEAVVPVGTGVGVFRVMSPVAVTVADIFFKKGYSVSLVVDEGSLMMQGRVSGGFGNLVDGNGSSIYVPRADVASNRPGDTIVGEIYVISLPSQNAQLRLTLYLINSQLLPTSASLSLIPSPTSSLLIPHSSTVSPSPHRKILDGLTRKTAVGDSDLVKLECGGFEGWSGACEGSVTVNYTLVANPQRQTSGEASAPRSPAPSPASSSPITTTSLSSTHGHRVLPKLVGQMQREAMSAMVNAAVRFMRGGYVGEGGRGDEARVGGMDGAVTVERVEEVHAAMDVAKTVERVEEVHVAMDVAKTVGRGDVSPPPSLPPSPSPPTSSTDSLETGQDVVDSYERHISDAAPKEPERILQASKVPSSVSAGLAVGVGVGAAAEAVRRAAGFSSTGAPTTCQTPQLSQVMTRELGSDWRSLFLTFDDMPIAAASIGQVHRATIQTDTGVLQVAVKVQYPGVATSIDSDLDYLRALATVGAVLPKGMYLENTIRVARLELGWECDYEREAEAMERFRALVEGLEGFHVPKVVKELSTKRVLCMEFVEGVPIGKVVELEQWKRDEIGDKLFHLCLQELFDFRFMQTDPNWSNFLYQSNTHTIHLLDFGAAREFKKSFTDDYLRVLMAAAEGIGRGAMISAHVNSILALAEPFTPLHRSKRFHFQNQDITRRVRSEIPLMLRERLTPPPDETYSLHRKLSGCFLLCAKLGARVRCRDIFERVVEGYRWE
ncbi:ABC1 family-domain-containing protein [Chytridium lagenaria]|nr:ABC1 family-domain-containing protein [Chytridium lagenaria]